MIASRTLFISCCIALAGCGEPSVDKPPEPPDADEPLVPKGPPSIEWLVDVDPEDDAVGFVPVRAEESVRYGDPFTVVVRNLPADAQVTLEAELYGMASRATFVVPPDGTVDLARAAPLAGVEGNTYDGVDPEGLLWSMSGSPLAARSI